MEIRGWGMGEVERVKEILVRALVEEEGSATAERLLYAYQELRSRFRSVGELLAFAEEHLSDEVEVEEHEYYPFRGDSEKAIYLKLRMGLERC